ncbi:hypothetical protein D3C75_538420 [compost metagenome]
MWRKPELLIPVLRATGPEKASSVRRLRPERPLFLRLSPGGLCIGGERALLIMTAAAGSGKGLCMNRSV